MRLRKIKLSGFKTFVDPTTLTVPGNLVGIVGPNGCGKSNIIDAVMWVMGESSAKHLRGDALTDVIFNGSSARNPVGQASVELIFDNTEDKLGGQYASYDEISIKRQINRDAISNYYLNGTRCRRRDIQAIFLGTGLGPRSYAIIEQGMISRLIEAKPEELRTFIEEAAGISKYRERRRETENRIRNTRENIARLNDIREELGKQLNHLHRQAKAAERYQVLKKEQRQLDAELQALNWRTLKKQSESDQEKVRHHENNVEAAVAVLRKTENEIVQERENLSTANDKFNQAQSNYYRVGGEISQQEQKIHHIIEKIADTEQELERAKQDLAAAKDQLKSDETRLKELQEKKTGLEPLLRGSRNESDKAYGFLNDAEQAMQAWQEEWETFNVSASDFVRRAEVGQTRLDHLELGIEENQERQKSLQIEQKDINRDSIQNEIKELEKNLKDQEKEFTNATRILETRRNKLLETRKSNQSCDKQLNDLRLSLQKQEGRLSSLEALQQSAMGEDQEDIKQWLKKAGLDKSPRLTQKINVIEEWAFAVEIVLARYLQDVCVDDIAGYTDKIGNLKTGHLGIVGAEKFVDVDVHSRFPSLADKIKGAFPLKHLLANVYLANSIKEAIAMRPNLAGNESVITRDGLWAGVNWIHAYHVNDDQSGLLSRQKEIESLVKDISTSRKEIASLEQRAQSGREETEKGEEELNEIQAQLNRHQEMLADQRAKLAASKSRLEQFDTRSGRIREEIESLQEQLEEDKSEISVIKNELKQVSKHLEQLDKQRAELTAIREKHRESLTRAREKWQQTHEQSHGIALQLESISSQRASLEQSMKRGQIHISHLTSRCSDLEKILVDNRAPIQQMKSGLEDKLKEKVVAEKLLSDARAQVQRLDNVLREKEENRNKNELHVQELRELLEKARLVTQESRVRLQTIEEKFRESNQVLEDILSGLDDEADQSTWKESLEQVTQKIHRLGPINLAAIDEFNQLTERKTYLDKQDEDLREALSTLENAIRKIDKESKARFKETFDHLNSNLQELFPQLFGGGNAYLELTGDDLLETGVTVMARPPGKRNSTIHLLSGGEKALTAVALVFSIFRLNPAPFCILDEVDAPLDDANVGRFSELVASMADDVQFIFITHNKITMEIAHQLLGVTMQEAGVSRLVSVDVDEAVKMAATA